MDYQDHLEMRDTKDLRQAIRNVLVHEKPGVVIETGTNRGLGSTSIVAREIEDTYLPGDRIPLHTMETSYKLYTEAKANLAKYPFVVCHHGLSLLRDWCIIEVSRNEFLDYVPAYSRKLRMDGPVQQYVHELNYGLEGSSQDPADRQDILTELIQIWRSQRPFFVLDSCGAIGRYEFRQTCKLMQGQRFSVLLDDCNHVKHHLSRLLILDNPEWKVWGDNQKEGWLVASYGGMDK